MSIYFMVSINTRTQYCYQKLERMAVILELSVSINSRLMAFSLDTVTTEA